MANSVQGKEFDRHSELKQGRTCAREQSQFFLTLCPRASRMRVLFVCRTFVRWLNITQVAFCGKYDLENLKVVGMNVPRPDPVCLKAGQNEWRGAGGCSLALHNQEA